MVSTAPAQPATVAPPGVRPGQASLLEPCQQAQVRQAPSRPAHHASQGSGRPAEEGQVGDAERVRPGTRPDRGASSNHPRSLT